MSKNDDYYKAAKAAIQNLYDDTSVSQEITRDNLRGIISECEMLIDTLTENRDGEL